MHMEDILEGDDMPAVSINELKKKGMNSKKINRMTHRSNMNKYLFYPENKFKMWWDLFMTLVLLITCLVTPVDIAFQPDTLGVDIMNILIDILFGCDILVIFNTVFYDNEVVLVEDRKEIAQNYLRGWFTVDVLAIVPFDKILNAVEFNSLVRVARVGRLYKLVKLTRLLRILKIMKEKSKLMKYLNDFLKIGLGFERLFFFILIFFIGCHITACLWLIIAFLNEGDEPEEQDASWVQSFKD